MQESAKKRGQYCLNVGKSSPTATFGLPSVPLFAASVPLFHPCASASAEGFTLHSRVALRPRLPKFGVSVGQTVTITTAVVLIPANRKIGGYFTPKRAAQFLHAAFSKKNQRFDFDFSFALFFSRVRYISRHITHYKSLYNLINHILLIFLFYR